MPKCIAVDPISSTKPQSSYSSVAKVGRSLVRTSKSSVNSQKLDRIGFDLDQYANELQGIKAEILYTQELGLTSADSMPSPLDARTGTDDGDAVLSYKKVELEL